MAGGANIASAMDTPWAQYSQEELIIQDPQIILLGDAMWGVTPEMVAERPWMGADHRHGRRPCAALQ